jgi:hypothetical protein
MGQEDIGLSALVARIDERTQTTAEQVDRLAHVLLEGNGSPPLTAQVATLTEKVSNIEEDRDANRVPLHVWIGIAVSVMLAALSLLVEAKVL